MKIRKFNESIENRKYLDVDRNTCPVCGEKQINIWSSSIDSADLEEITEHFYIDYECQFCDFKWYSEFTFTKLADAYTGDEIIEGNKVPENSYKPEKIEAKKYNL